MHMRKKLEVKKKGGKSYRHKQKNKKKAKQINRNIVIDGTSSDESLAPEVMDSIDDMLSAEKII